MSKIILDSVAGGHNLQTINSNFGATAFTSSPPAGYRAGIYV